MIFIFTLIVSMTNFFTRILINYIISFNIVKISYYNKNIEDKTEVGSKLFRHRCNLIFDSLEHEYDLYIFFKIRHKKLITQLN